MEQCGSVQPEYLGPYFWRWSILIGLSGWFKISITLNCSLQCRPSLSCPLYSQTQHAGFVMNPSLLYKIGTTYVYTFSRFNTATMINNYWSQTVLRNNDFFCYWNYFLGSSVFFPFLGKVDYLFGISIKLLKSLLSRMLLWLAISVTGNYRSLCYTVISKMFWEVLLENKMATCWNHGFNHSDKRVSHIAFISFSPSNISVC